MSVLPKELFARDAQAYAAPAVHERTQPYAFTRSAKTRTSIYAPRESDASAGEF